MIMVTKSPDSTVSSGGSPDGPMDPATARDAISVVIPYYNEAGYIGATLRSLLTQTRPPDEIILVDNASTDGSEAVCRAVLAESPHPRVKFLRDDRPGKVNALETGCAAVGSGFTALCDADMVYPAHYLEAAARLFAEAPPDTAAVMAVYVESSPRDSAAARARVRRIVRASRAHPGKCLTGGGGQIFRTRVLHEAGGFSAAQWNYVLMDHEIVHRVHKAGGRSLYHDDMWVLHTDRRKDRRDVRWALLDRILYRYTPAFLGDWFFYWYLMPRFHGKRMFGLNLRRQPWAAALAGQDEAGGPNRR